jgi:spore coat polysaccharide biosynthesis protein SpsF
LTKLAPLDGLSDSADKAEAAQAVHASVETSRRALCRETLDVLLLHRARHLRACDGAIWDTLLSLRQMGVIGRLGVSVQSTDELDLALSFRDCLHIQMPVNVFDWRFRKPSVLTRIAERPEVTIHARSTLLQGLLTARSAALWPRFPGLDIPHLLRALAALVEVFGRRDVADLCFAYVRAKSFVHGIVVGAETAAQVEANAALFKRAPLKRDEVEFVESFVPHLPETLLDPARWPRKKAA